MSEQEQEPLMWSTRAEEEIAKLMRQIQRLVLHHNDTHDPALRIDQVDVQIHLPAYAMIQNREIDASGAKESQ